MSLYKRPGNEVWSYDFWYKKVRFAASTGEGNKERALKVENGAKDAARAKFASQPKGAPVINLTAATQLGKVSDRYWLEIGQHHAGAANTKRDLERIVNYF